MLVFAGGAACDGCIVVPFLVVEKYLESVMVVWWAGRDTQGDGCLLPYLLLLCFVNSGVLLALLLAVQ